MPLGLVHRNMLPAIFRNVSHNHIPMRQLQAAAALRPVPIPRDSSQTPEVFLTSIGRSCETKLKVSDWSELWKMGGAGMKKAGVGVKDRRYILWSLEKYRQGQDPSDFAHPETPKKKIRGWGPSVQFGKRIRSRRHR